MKVRTFTAKSYSTALQMVKEHLGNDAVILSNQLVPPERGKEHLGPAVEISAVNGEGASALIHEMPRLRQRAHAHHAAFDGRGNEEIPKVLKPFRRRLLEEEVRERLVDRLMGDVLKRIAPLGPQGSSRALHHLLIELMERVSIFSENRWRKGRQYTCVVGASGVGKSTMLAKLAVVAALKEKQTVVLAHLGRRGVVADALKLAARVIDCPLSEIASPPALSSLVDELPEGAHLFLDAPGVSPFDEKALDRLKALLARVPGASIHLALNASSRDIDILRGFDAFGRLGLSAMAFTRLDEDSCFGGILNAMDSCRLPLSYFGFGREIPSDIERASKERVVDLLLDLSAQIEAEVSA